MKTFRNLLLLPALLSVQTLFAQSNSHLKLSDEHPTAGEKISFTYDPAGTALDGKSDVKAIVYFYDNKDNPAIDVDLKADGKLLKGYFAVAGTAKAFFVKLFSDKTTDNNGENGYVYIIYKDGKPVEGAYASEGLIYNGLGKSFAGIKRDKDQAIEFYKQDIQAYPDKNDNEGTYYSLIAGNPKYKPEFDQKLKSLAGSSDEKNIILLYNMFISAQATDKADSVKQILNNKYPDNDLVKNGMINTIMREQDIPKKDSLFTAYAKKNPEKPADASLFNYIRYQLASGYAKKDDIANFEKYKNQMTDKQLLTGLLNNMAWNWAEEGKNLAEAEKLSKQSVDILQGQLDHPEPSAFAPPSLLKASLQSSWNMNADTYAYILWKENKSAEALPIMKKVYDLTSDEANSIEHYAEILGGAGQYAKAMEVIEKGMRAGQSSPAIKDELKKDYIKVKGSDSGYDQYLASLEATAKAKTLADLAKTMINQPAPNFTLKDLDGNTVSLADLKGKVVIVDFWATWCGPCKASFPGMQMAVNKYKDNPDVKFLFVDTWENGKDYEPGVKKFIADNKYTFHVLMDEKTDEGRQAKVVTAYGVEGIPTKFVIDKNGNIRFKYMGFSGSSDGLLDEVINMIELTSKPELANTQPAKDGKTGR